MTCVVGVKHNNKVYMASDLLGSNKHTKALRKDGKVFVKNNILFGGTSSYRMIQLLQYSLVIPEHLSTQSVDEYLRTSFIDAIRDLFKKNGYASIDNNEETGGTFLIGYRGRLFTVFSDYQVAENDSDYSSVGSGSDIALGAMFATEDLPPADRLTIAITAASEFNPYVAGMSKVYVLE